MNGFIFADTPALLSPDRAASDLRADVQTYWPQRSRELRFYGMGFDAYGLIASLYANDGTPWTMRGLSGDLSLDAAGSRPARAAARAVSERPARRARRRAAAPIDSGGLIGER